MDDRLRNADPLPEAERQRRDEVVAHRRQLERLFDTVRRPPRLRARNSPQARREDQVLVDGHLAVEGRRLGEVSDAPAHLVRCLDDVEAVHLDGARRRQEIAREDAKRRGLAGPVQAEEAHDLAAFDRERKGAGGAAVPVEFEKVDCLDHRLLRRS